MTRESRIVKDLYADAHILATLYDQAARALEAAQAGWPTSLDRFLAKVSVDPETGCWNWTAGKERTGYGKFWVDDHTLIAHRWHYKHVIGPVPDGLQLDHLCRNRSCVKLDHLEPVTARENTMRSNAPSAINATKTHCPQGHPYSGDNLMIQGGRRLCRICKLAQKKQVQANWVAAHPEEHRRRKEAGRARDNERRRERRKRTA